MQADNQQGLVSEENEIEPDFSHLELLITFSFWYKSKMIFLQSSIYFIFDSILSFKVKDINKHNKQIGNTFLFPLTCHTVQTVCVFIPDDILTQASDVFEDVVEDFSEMDSIRDRFAAWKKKYRDTYTEAYIGLCLPKLVNPFVRLQLISWNPLEVSNNVLSQSTALLILFHLRIYT